MRDLPVFPPQRRRRRLGNAGWILVLRRLLLLLLKLLGLRHIVLCPFEACVRKVAASHPCKDHRDQMRRDPSIQRRPEHILLYLALLESESLLLRLLLLLFPLILFRLRMQPVPHRFLGALPLRRRRQLSQGLGHGRRLLT